MVSAWYVEVLRRLGKVMVVLLIDVTARLMLSAARLAFEGHLAA